MEQKWMKSGTKVEQKWNKSGTKVEQKWTNTGTRIEFTRMTLSEYTSYILGIQEFELSVLLIELQEL